MSGALDFLLTAWRTRTLEVGPLAITTHQRVSEREWNAFHLGRDVGASIGPSPWPEPPRDRHLHVVS